MGVAVAGRKLDDAQPVAMRVQPHRLGIDRDRRPEIDAFGKVAAVKPVSHLGAESAQPALPSNGAQEKTRTSTSYRPLEPESSASTNSATWARQS